MEYIQATLKEEAVLRYAKKIDVWKRIDNLKFFHMSSTDKH